MEEKHGNKLLIVVLAILAVLFIGVVSLIIVYVSKNIKKPEGYEEKEITEYDDGKDIETEVVKEELPEIPVNNKSFSLLPGDKASIKINGFDKLKDFKFEVNHPKIADVKNGGSGNFTAQALSAGSSIMTLKAEGYADTRVRIRVGTPSPTPKPSPFDQPQRGSIKPDKLTVGGRQIDVYALDGFELTDNKDPDHLVYSNVNDPGEFYTVYSHLPDKMYEFQYVNGYYVAGDPDYNFYYENTGYAVQDLGEIYIGYATDYADWGSYDYRYYMLVGDIATGDMIAVEFLEKTQLPWYEDEYGYFAHWIFGDLDPNYTGVSNPRSYNGSTGSGNYNTLDYYQDIDE